MTAELADAFATKREGVAFVLDAAAAAFGDASCWPSPARASWSAPPAARARPLELAAANWAATALAVAAVHDALMIDVGAPPPTSSRSPRAGRPPTGAPTSTGSWPASWSIPARCARTRGDRAAVPARGGSCPVAAELFAITADVHLVLGHLAPDGLHVPHAGRPGASAERSRERLARLVCADLEQLEPGEIDAIAAYLHAAQVRRIRGRRPRSRALRAAAGVVLLGEGAVPRARGGGAPRRAGSSCGRAPPSGRRRRRPRSPAGGTPARVLSVVKSAAGSGAR